VDEFSALDGNRATNWKKEKPGLRFGLIVSRKPGQFIAEPDGRGAGGCFPAEPLSSVNRAVTITRFEDRARGNFREKKSNLGHLSP